ncbi:MiAMP1 family antimicrobial peptide [Kribbella sp. NPDC056951]|uniref:MiAMP1 family antimicrobial peptide n=1 Tax=Kribbella sp. NPDC056951 TaxID=3345978 RepID=UPI00362972D2
MKTVLRLALTGLGSVALLGGGLATASAAPVYDDAEAGPLTVAATSSFVAYSGSSWSGFSKDINGCGLHRIPYSGSYRWYARGQSGHLFNNTTGTGVPHTRLPSDANKSSASGFGWKSILIVC